MSLQERLDDLYPVGIKFTEDDIALLKQVGMSDEDAKVLQSRLIAKNHINQKLREAYLTGRAEKDLYKDETVHD